MKTIWNSLLLLLIAYIIIGCTNPSSSEPNPPSVPLRSGLWLPQNPTTSNPTAWIIQEDPLTVSAIEGNQYATPHTLKAIENGGWKAESLREIFFDKEQSKSAQVQIVTPTDTVLYNLSVKQSQFSWSVTNLQELDTLLQDTSVWQEEGSNRIVAFYQPVCPQVLQENKQAFDKAALVFETPTRDPSFPSDYRQQLSFNYQGGLLYFFMEHPTTAQLERYVVLEMTQQKWTLLSLTVPYPLVVWNRVAQPNTELSKILITHNNRLKKEQTLKMVDCPE